MQNGNENKNLKRNAYQFILILGLVSLFSDFTHEGARSIYGSYLSLLGASALVISTVAGLGEFLGQGLRLLTGFLTDKTKKYWLFAIIGYGFNLIVIPLLAFIPMDGWMLACILILTERVGKAIRAPAKSTLVSFAGKEIGVGKTFAYHEALDQLGAFLGPLLISLIMTLRKGSDIKTVYAICFLALGGTALISFIILLIAKRKYPNPNEMEKAKNLPSQKITNKIFWLYIAAIGFIAAGFCDYPLIALRLESFIDVNLIPLYYSMAMAVDAVSALFFGWLFDKKGILSLIIAVIINSLFAIFIFIFNDLYALIAGVIIWGIGMGAQESILKAVIASIVPKEKRATAYGIFNTGFGLFWFLGSLLLGLLYGYSFTALALTSMALELLSIPFLFAVRKKLKLQIY